MDDSRLPLAAPECPGGLGDRLAFPLDYWTDPYGPTHLPLPDYIKLDTDGCEAEVLKGATRTLKHVKKLMVEHDSEVESHKLIPGLLEGLGLYEEAVYPHGTSSVSNVLYGRR